ncbi:MAG: lysoplasmalogenase [Sandarakinorhabdus sp.]|nr:lysoplasmalogenase [Sandarakinorhabdus sp.]
MLAASLLAGLAYPLAHGCADRGLPPFGSVIAKGLGVGLLALAATLLKSPQRWWLAAIMVAGALGDMLLDSQGLFLVGAGVFAFGHCIAMAYYGLNARSDVAIGARLAAAALVGWGLAMPGLVSPAGTPVGALMLYSVLLCGMAAALLLSQFSRVALAGALLFVLSDTLLIMRLGGRLLGGEVVHGLLIWFTYYVGQALIFVGVARSLTQTRR